MIPNKKSAKRQKEIRGKMRYPVIVISALIIGICVLAYADEGNKAKGLEMVSEMATTAVDKVNALLTGNLEITMSGGSDTNKNEYTTNAIGQRVPVSTRSYNGKGPQTATTPE